METESSRIARGRACGLGAVDEIPAVKIFRLFPNAPRRTAAETKVLLHPVRFA